jgi:nicotinamidase-related amidase
LIGTPGHNIIAPLRQAMLNWEILTNGTTDFVTKGSNPCVEHFSAVQAEVPFDGDDTMGLKADPSTQLNAECSQVVMEADEILLSGEAGSHCLANTVRDMANTFADDSFIRKCILLTDGTSPVGGFEFLQNDFVKEMTGRGMKTTTTKDYLA